MKKQFTTAAKILLLSSASLCSIVSCKKENLNGASQQSQNYVSSYSDENSVENLGYKLIGYYALTGTRTNYLGSVSDSIISEVIDLSLYSPKIITIGAAPKTLVCDYANLGSLAWQYVITPRPHQRDFNLDPNDEMASQIEPGSWVEYAKSFDSSTRTFYLKTGYTNTSGNGRIVEETLTWQSK